MTLVTTSRKAIPEVRTFARAFAIATGSGFMTRGKTGLPDLFTRDPHIVLFTREPQDIRVRFFLRGSPVADYRVAGLTVENREGAAIKGFGTGDPGDFSSIAGMVPVSAAAVPAGKGGCIIDGQQKKRYAFRLVPYGT